MTSPPEHDAAARRGITLPAAEVAVALLLLVLAGLVIVDSLRLGMRWADDGPQAGYFPFYVGLALAIAGLIILVRGVLQAQRERGQGDGGGKLFVSWDRLRPVGAMLGPLALYLLAIRWLGLYAASLLFIAYCMRRMGRYGWLPSVALPVLVVLALYLLFEVWFKIPLVKGPIEAALGLA